MTATLTSRPRPAWDDWKVQIPEGTHGAVEVRHFEVPEHSIENVRLMLQGGRQTRPGNYTALHRNGRLWMSDTDAEVSDHWPADRALYAAPDGARVLVAGLGLGMIVRRALAYDHVSHVDVVEIDPDVCALIGPVYASDRCTIHQADIYDIAWPKGTRWDVAWFDVWPDLCTDNLESMGRLGRSYGRRCSWSGYWGKELLQAQRRREQRQGW